MTDEIQRMKSLQSIFPRASKSFIEANPRLLLRMAYKSDNPQSSPTKTPKNAVQPVLKRKRGKMTGVEREYGLMLEAQKRAGEILRYEFQGMTLRWGVDEKTGDSMKYTPDWVVFDDGVITKGDKVAWKIRLIEIKDQHIHYRQQAIARFKGCRAWWPEFSFELWQKQKDIGWKQIL
jgi:hypothetical protein